MPKHPICVGIAPTKVLSKIANRIAKKHYDKTGGSYVIDTEEKRIKAIKWLKIEDVWGIGHRLGKKLKAQNVHTAYDYTLPHMEAWIKKEMGVVGMRIRYELMGEPVLGPNPIPEIRKNISTTRSFPKMLSDFDLIRERVSTFATVTAEKLRKQGSLCHTIIVMLTADKFSLDKVKYHYSKARTLPYPTNSALTMSKVAIELVKELMDSTDTVVFKKTGVIATELVPADAKQFNMFADEDPRHLALMNAMDKINNKMGDRKIRLGAQAIKTWDMRQDMLSPRFTTNFNEILVAKCH
jgi:DNA polymerase V